MKRHLIESDIQKMKSLINYKIGETITEQEEKYGNCSGSNEIQPPVIGQLKINKDQEGKPVNIVFSFRAYFGAAKSSVEVYMEALSSVKQKMTELLAAENLEGLYTLDLVTMTKVVGSASNYYKGALQPTWKNNGYMYKPEELSKPPFDTLPKPGDSNWDTNMVYAENRWKGLVNVIKTKGKELGFTVKDGIEPEQITAKITDTGGCTDEKRDSSKYPKAGQYVQIGGIMNLIPRELTTGEKEKLFNCAKGLRVIVGYFAPREGGRKISGISVPANSGSHACDYATFDIKCNDIPVGIANMNNGTSYFGKNPKATVGTDKSDNPNLVERISPSERGGSAINVLGVSDDLLKQMIEKSPNGLLNLTIQGKRGTMVRDLYHGDAPMVCAYTVDENGKLLSRIYGPREPFGKSAGDVSGEERELVKFNPCTKKSV
jgi:hypothetical protein